MSIDPTETPAMVCAKNKATLREALRPAGDRRRLALSHRPEAGYRRRYIRHPASAMCACRGRTASSTSSRMQARSKLAHHPQGKLAQYYLGVEYSPKDVLLGLIDASGNKIGSPVANILTYCYHYDPQTNKMSLRVARVVQVRWHGDHGRPWRLHLSHVPARPEARARPWDKVRDLTESTHEENGTDKG